MSSLLTMMTATRADVMAANSRPLVQLLRGMTTRPRAWRRLRGSVLFSVDGWNHDPREIYEIPEVRTYWAKVDAAFPAWTYFSVPGGPLAVLALCLLPDLRVVSTGRIGEFARTDFASADMTAFLEKAMASVTAAAIAHNLDDASVELYAYALGGTFGPSANAA